MRKTDSRHRVKLSRDDIMKMWNIMDGFKARRSVKVRCLILIYADSGEEQTMFGGQTRREIASFLKIPLSMVSRTIFGFNKRGLVHALRTNRNGNPRHIADLGDEYEFGYKLGEYPF